MLHNAAAEELHLNSFLELLLNRNDAHEALRHLSSLSAAQREEMLKLADSHHVFLRVLRPLLQHATIAGDAGLTLWAAAAIKSEEEHIGNALKFLHEICDEMESSGCPTTVMKSLDHCPDLGNDLDLYSSTDPSRVARVLASKFYARMEPRSWGDRLANKWNFAVPGLKESIEFHIQRLGQTGEHTSMAQRFISRRVVRNVNGMNFYVPAPEERIVVATLQRMYRHFYFRVCDIVNSAGLVESGAIDFAELQRATEQAGIWPGVATYLAIVCHYVKQYRGEPLSLPRTVLDAARFGGEKIRIKSRFLRVPIMPEGASLFTHQVTQAALKGDVPATLRLNLLPPLAIAAAVAYKLTGSDKGVW